MAAEGIVLSKIISGGQTGADQGGLAGARELGIATGGTAPQGWWTENGSDRELLHSFGLTECLEPGYDARTKKNVLDADGTALFGSYATGGSALTAKIANESGKPFFHIPFPAGEGREALAKTAADFCEWLRRFQIRVLNIAGNRESQNPGVHEFTRKFLISNLESK